MAKRGCHGDSQKRSRGCGRAQSNRGAPKEAIGDDQELETVEEINRAKVAGTGHSKGMIMRSGIGRRYDKTQHMEAGC